MSLTGAELAQRDMLRAKAIRASNIRLDYDTILHIGRHKAGTTALQYNLTKNSDVLARLGFCYPEMHPGTSKIAHHTLSEIFRPRSPDGLFAEALSNSLDLASRLKEMHFQSLILSSENFQNTRPKNLQLVFDPTRCRVVVYVREQYEYAQSAYSQAVHARKITASFSSFIREFNINYETFLSKWVSEFEPRELVVRVYARDQLINRDIVHDFCNINDIPVADFKTYTDNTNPGIGGPLLTFKREINKLPIPLKDLSVIYKPLGELAEQNQAFRQKPFLPNTEIKSYRKQFVTSNNLVARSYFDRDNLFDISAPKSAYNEKNDVDFIGDICNALASTRVAPRLFQVLKKGFDLASPDLSPYLIKLKREL